MGQKCIVERFPFLFKQESKYFVDIACGLNCSDSSAVTLDGAKFQMGVIFFSIMFSECQVGWDK